LNHAGAIASEFFSGGIIHDIVLDNVAQIDCEYGYCEQDLMRMYNLTYCPEHPTHMAGLNENVTSLLEWRALNNIPDFYTDDQKVCLMRDPTSIELSS
jgi:hypothetical protein